MKLLAALSGGVDSSVCAALMLDAGHEVTGVTLKQWDDPTEPWRRRKGCSVIDAVSDARRACDVLGIAHYTLNVVDDFEREVIAPWVDGYAAGTTPNPCLRCNERIRFGLLRARAAAMGFDGIVTGHYARIAPSGRVARARDLDRDQSYVLYGLVDTMGVHFPLGEVDSKAWVRAEAARRGLLNAQRDDSVDVCFIAEDETAGDLVVARRPDAGRPGAVLDAVGRVVGTHHGIARYTIGQRRGLPAMGRRVYVTSIDPTSNTVVAGDRSDLAVHTVRVRDARYAPAGSASGLTAVLRYRGEAHPCEIEPSADTFVLQFAEPVFAAAPGQAAVVYDGDEIVAGGIIERSS